MAPQGSTDSIPPEIQKLYEEAKKNGKFVDHEFPAQNSTMGDPSKANYAKLTANLAWYRPS